MSFTREDAISFAIAAAAAKPESYYAEPFVPHEWVIDAIMNATHFLQQSLEGAEQTVSMMEEAIEKAGLKIVDVGPLESTEWRLAPIEPPKPEQAVGDGVSKCPNCDKGRQGYMECYTCDGTSYVVQPKPEQAVGDGVDAVREIAFFWRPLLSWALGTIDELNDGPLTAGEVGEDAALYQQARSLITSTPRPAVATPAEVTDATRALLNIREGFDFSGGPEIVETVVPARRCREIVALLDAALTTLTAQCQVRKDGQGPAELRKVVEWHRTQEAIAVQDKYPRKAQRHRKMASVIEAALASPSAGAMVPEDKPCPVCGDPLGGDKPCVPPVVGWMLRDPAGGVYFDETCIFLDQETAQEAADRMLEPDGEVYVPFPVIDGEKLVVEPFELRICELRHVILQRDRSYIFTVDPNCEKCREVAQFGHNHRKTEEPRLNAPARVGGTTFGAGVFERLVIERAQREYVWRKASASRDAELAEVRRDALEMAFRYFGIPEKPRLKLAGEFEPWLRFEDLQALQKKLAEHFGEDAKRTFAFYWAELNPKAAPGYQFSYNGFSMNDVPEWVVKGMSELGQAHPVWGSPILDPRSPERVRQDEANRKIDEARAKVEECYKQGMPIQFTPLDDPLAGWIDATRILKIHNGRFIWDTNDYRVDPTYYHFR